MASLNEFLESTDTCHDLRQKAVMFLVEVKPNLITTFECPVCREDLRRTFQFGIQRGRGSCICCKMGIQMVHDLVHEGHEGCSVTVNFPVSLCDPELTKRLRRAWVHLFGEILASRQEGIDLERWVAEAQEIMAVYNSSRKPT